MSNIPRGAVKPVELCTIEAKFLMEGTIIPVNDGPGGSELSSVAGVGRDRQGSQRRTPGHCLAASVERSEWSQLVLSHCYSEDISPAYGILQTH